MSVAASVLLIDAWRPSQPNAKSGVQCVKSYLGEQNDKLICLLKIDLFMY